MAKSLGGFRAALLTGWILLSAFGVLYARAKGIPLPAALPVLAAFCVQFPFYLAAGFPAVRERLAGRMLPVWLIAATLLPYLICCCGAIPFDFTAFVRLAAVAAAWSLWYIVLPAGRLTDLAFLALTGAVSLGRYFDSIYPIFHREHLATIGRISLFIVSILVLMLQRRVAETGFGFWPRPRDWRIGALHFLYFLPVGAALAFLLKATHFVPPRPIWVPVAMFFAFLWVVGLWEEFLVRGVFQQWLEDWTASPQIALLIASAVFGLVHYVYRGWPWVPLAGALGWFCGRARNRAGDIRAGLVTHALTVALWRAFLW